MPIETENGPVAYDPSEPQQGVWARGVGCETQCEVAGPSPKQPQSLKSVLSKRLVEARNEVARLERMLNRINTDVEAEQFANDVCRELLKRGHL